MPKSKDKLLTVREVANYLRVSERSVLRYIEDSRLKASKVGWWCVLQSDLDEFLKRTSNLNNKNHENKRFAKNLKI